MSLHMIGHKNNNPENLASTHPMFMGVSKETSSLHSQHNNSNVFQTSMEHGEQRFSFGKVLKRLLCHSNTGLKFEENTFFNNQKNINLPCFWLN